MKCVNDFRLRFGRREFVPIVIGGMGVDISRAELALEGARLGGIGHISDAMVPTVSDRRFRTHFVKEKAKLYKYNAANSDKSAVQFDLGQLAEATNSPATIHQIPSGVRVERVRLTETSSSWAEYSE